ncbi:MAG TPA: ABC transporter permease, partial [Vicinamibacteria bacterium]
MRALWHMVVKEFLQLRQDKKVLPSLFVAPLVQLLALGYAANLDVTDIPTLLVDQDRSRESRALVLRFTGSGYFRVVGAEDTVERVEPWLEENRAQIALVIARGYGADVAAGRAPRIQVLADGTDSNSAVVGLGYASRIVGELGASLRDARLQREPTLRVPTGGLELEPRIFYNPDLRSRWFYVPAVVAMVLMLVTMILPSMAVVREKEIGTLEQIIVTPLRPWQLVMGKLAPFVFIGIVDMLLVTGVARVLFGVPLRGSLLLLTGMTLLFLLSTLGLGLLVSTIVATQQQAMMFSAFVLMVPMIYLSGLIFPVENMPRLFQQLSVLIPVRYYTVVLRGIFLKGSGIDVLWPEGLALLAIGSVVIVLAALRFRKR